MSGNNTDARVQIGTAFPGMTFPDEIQNGSQLGSATYKEFQHLYAQLEGFLRAAGFNPDGTFNNLVTQSITIVTNYNQNIPPTVIYNQTAGTVYVVNNEGDASIFGGPQCCPDVAGVGSLVFTSYGDDGPWQFLSPQGVNLGQIPNPVTNDVASLIALADGTVVAMGTASGTAFYSEDFGTVTYPADAVTIGWGIGVDASSNIYGSKAGLGDKKIRKVTSAGVFVADYSLASTTTTVSSVAVNSAGTKIYFSGTDAVTAPLKTTKEVYVLDTGSGVITLFVSEASYECRFNSIVVVPYTGDVLVAWNGAGLTGYVKHYDSSGVLKHTYSPTVNGLGTSPEGITRGLTDFTIWAALGANVDTNSGTVIAEIQLETGTVLNQFAADDGTSFYYGSPFCVLRAPIPAAT